MARIIPPQYHIPVHVWAGPNEHMSVPALPAHVVPTFAQWLKGLPDLESHHLVIYDPRAG